jgi:hypothetical protein
LDSEATKNSQPTKLFIPGAEDIAWANPESPSTNPETRREIQLEYPSDIDEFNRIVGSSQGKNDLLKELGIIEEGK